MNPEIDGWWCWNRGGEGEVLRLIHGDRPRAMCHFKNLIDNVEAFLDPLADPKANYLANLMDYAKTRDDAAEFCRFYVEWLRSPLAKRLKAGVYQLLEEAITS